MRRAQTAVFGMLLASLPAGAVEKPTVAKLEAPAGPAQRGVGTLATCFDALERATLMMVVQEPFEAATILYAAAPLCHMLPEMWSMLALTDVVLRSPDRARQTLKTLSLRPETQRWARILGAALDAAAGDMKGARAAFAVLSKEWPKDERVLLSLAAVEAIRGSAAGRRAIIDLVKLGYAPLAREWRVLPVEDIAVEIFLEAARRTEVAEHEVAGKHAALLANLASRLDIDHTRWLRARAVELTDIALAAKPDNGKLWIMKRDLVSRLEGDPHAVCDAMSKSVSREHEVLRCRARTAYEQRLVTAMCDSWKKLLWYRPQDVEAKVGSVLCEWWTRGAYPAQAAVGEESHDAPGSPLALLRGYSLLDSGEPTKAVEWFRGRAKEDDSDLVLLRALSVALRRAGEITQFETLARFVAKKSDADRQSYVYRAMASHRQRRYQRGVDAIITGDLDGAATWLGEGTPNEFEGLLSGFGLLKVALASGDKALINRRTRVIQRWLKRANLPFFGGLTKEWQEGRDQLEEQRDASTDVVSGSSAGTEVASADNKSVRDAVSELLGLERRLIIRSPEGAPPGMGGPMRREGSSSIGGAPPGMPGRMPPGGMPPGGMPPGGMPPGGMPPGMTMPPGGMPPGGMPPGGMPPGGMPPGMGRPSGPGSGAVPPGAGPDPSQAGRVDYPGESPAEPVGVHGVKRSDAKERARKKRIEKKLEFDLMLDQPDVKVRR